MVTERQHFRAVNLLYYRRKLNYVIPELDQKLHSQFEENEIDYLNNKGYQIMRNNGSIIIEELPAYDVDQLSLFMTKNTKSQM